WVAGLDKNDPDYDRHMVEAMWVTWGLDKVDEGLVRQVMQSRDFQARGAAVRVVRYSGHKLENQAGLLMQAAKDEHGRVRLEAIVAASWLDKQTGLAIVNEAAKMPLDEWMIHAHETAVAHLNGQSVQEKKESIAITHLKGSQRDQFIKGKRSEEHTSELQSRENLVCRLLLEKKK